MGMSMNEYCKPNIIGEMRTDLFKNHKFQQIESFFVLKTLSEKANLERFQETLF
jgi:hypothetical protein